ncbi:MAG: HAMP domain-containing histidine kinase [Candidatus Krumholzibacteriota bacterium]|nr:HAMP domain-containing histidine kinase [Candidatus Krumholzibacteriota bacterium]
MLRTRGKGPLAGQAEAEWLREVQGQRSYADLAGWLGRCLARDLPDGRGLLVLRAPLARPWSVFSLPEVSPSEWEGDHPVIEELQGLPGAETAPLEESRAAGFPAGEQIRARPFHDSRGELLGALLVALSSEPSLTDDWLADRGRQAAFLAERLFTDHRLALMERELDELETLKSTFLSTVSHELKTPLTSIIGFASLAREQPDLEDRPHLRQFLDAIHDSALRLERLISEVLVLSRMDSAEITLDVAEHDFAVLLRDFRAAHLPRIDPDGRVRLTEPLPRLRISADGRQVLRILEHLIANALRFSAADRPVRLDWSFIQGRRRTDCCDYLRVNVSDEGVGIPEDEQERIFARFYQVDHSATREHGGAGLGLALAREFTRAMGGKLWVRSSVGKGSTFSFTLPVPRPNPGPAALKPAAPAEPAARR